MGPPAPVGWAQDKPLDTPQERGEVRLCMALLCEDSGPFVTTCSLFPLVLVTLLRASQGHGFCVRRLWVHVPPEAGPERTGAWRLCGSREGRQEGEGSQKGDGTLRVSLPHAPLLKAFPPPRATPGDGMPSNFLAGSRAALQGLGKAVS